MPDTPPVTPLEQAISRLTRFAETLDVNRHYMTGQGCMEVQRDLRTILAALSRPVDDGGLLAWYDFRDPAIISPSPVDDAGLIERVNAHTYKLPQGFYSGVDYGCDADSPESLIMAILDSGPRGTEVMQELAACGYSIVKTTDLGEVTDALASLSSAKVEVERLRETGEALVAKLDKCDPNDLPYVGTQYGVELEAFRAALKGRAVGGAK